MDGTGSSHCFTPRCVTSDLSWNDPHLREKVIRQITNSSHTSPTRYKNKLAIAKLWGVMDGFDSFLILSDQNCFDKLPDDNCDQNCAMPIIF